MRKLNKLAGENFGRLTVVEAVDTKSGIKWLCECACTSFCVVRGNHLRSGTTKSCGCLQREAATTHGMFGTPVYIAWADMLQRCNNPNNKNYKHYGGRGIFVCERWNDFANFYEDMGDRPDGLTLERINNNLGYSAANCTWINRTAQSRNKRINKNNRTGERGVSWRKAAKKYVAQIYAEGRNHCLGLFPTIAQAAVARKKGEQKYWGQP